MLQNKIEDASGDRYGTPTINFPVYATLEVIFFRVIRLNVAAVMVSNLDKL